MATIIALLALLQSAAPVVAQLPFPRIADRLPGPLGGKRQPIKVTATIPLFDSYCYRDVSKKGASGLCELSATPLGIVSAYGDTISFIPIRTMHAQFAQ